MVALRLSRETAARRELPVKNAAFVRIWTIRPNPASCEAIGQSWLHPRAAASGAAPGLGPLRASLRRNRCHRASHVRVKLRERFEERRWPRPCATTPSLHRLWYDLRLRRAFSKSRFEATSPQIDESLERHDFHALRRPSSRRADHALRSLDISPRLAYAFSAMTRSCSQHEVGGSTSTGTSRASATRRPCRRTTATLHRTLVPAPDESRIAPKSLFEKTSQKSTSEPSAHDLPHRHRASRASRA